jgi:hypothetical protein
MFFEFVKRCCGVGLQRKALVSVLECESMCSEELWKNFAPGKSKPNCVYEILLSTIIGGYLKQDTESYRTIRKGTD